MRAPEQLGANAVFPGVARGRWTIVWLLFAASLINYLDRSSISLALPLLSRDLRLGPESKGVIAFGLLLVCTPFMQIPDRLGCVTAVNLRWLYFAAFLLWSVSQGLTGFCRQPRAC